MSNPVQIKKMDIQHEQLLRLAISNPFATLDQLAEISGMTRPWLSVVMNSDCFKAQLAEMQKEINGRITESVVTDLVAHMRDTAIVGVKRLNTLVSSSTDTKEVKDATAMLLDSLNMGPTKKLPGVAVNIQTNNNLVGGAIPASVYQNARAKIGESVDVLPNPGKGFEQRACVGPQDREDNAATEGNGESAPGDFVRVEVSQGELF